MVVGRFVYLYCFLGWDHSYTLCGPPGVCITTMNCEINQQHSCTHYMLIQWFQTRIPHFYQNSPCETSAKLLHCRRRKARLYAATLSRLVSVYESSFWTSEEIHETSYNRSDAIWQASVRAENISRRTDNIDQQRGRQISREVRAILAPLEGARSEHVRCWYGVFGRSGSHTFKTCSQRINRTELANCSQSTSWRRHAWPITRPVIGSTWCRYVHYCSVQFCPLWTPL